MQQKESIHSNLQELMKLWQQWPSFAKQ